jgi:hypothetical protein
MWKLNADAAEFRPMGATDPVSPPVAGPPTQAPTEDYIPLASAKALAALEKLLGGNPALQVLLTEVRRGFQIVDSKKELLLERIAELELNSLVHEKSSAKLSARAVLENTEREITLSAGD